MLFYSRVVCLSDTVCYEMEGFLKNTTTVVWLIAVENFRMDVKDPLTVGMVKKTMTGNDGSTYEEKRYYICSIGGDAEELGRAARGHWKVENNLHWQLDFTFRDDKNRSMAKTGAKNLQSMKKIVMAVLNTVKTSYKLSMKRIRDELSLDYENEAERLPSMLDINAVKEALDSKGKSPEK